MATPKSTSSHARGFAIREVLHFGAGAGSRDAVVNIGSSPGDLIVAASPATAASTPTALGRGSGASPGSAADFDAKLEKQPPPPQQLATSVASPTLLQKAVSECLGTFVLVFAGCGSILVSNIYPGSFGIGGIAAVWGAAVTAVVYATGHVSGAHINPAITIGFAAVNRFPWAEVPAYIVAQCIGSVFANLALKLVLDRAGTFMHIAVTAPGLHSDNMQAFVMELIITLVLMFVICGVATDSRAVGDLTGVAIGATVVMNVLIAGLVSGCSMNPARSLGSAIVTSIYTSLYVYIFGPILGATIGAGIYTILRLPDTSKVTKKIDDEFASPLKRLMINVLTKTINFRRNT